MVKEESLETKLTYFSKNLTCHVILQAERKGTHSFHEKQYMEEINVFLIDKNVDSALGNPPFRMSFFRM